MNKQKPHDIAIIGMACRFPRAKNIQQYWQNLISGAETARLIPADRWQTNDHFDPQPGTAGKSISKWGCFLDDIWGFDPEFFNLTKEESLFIDPQHRILLELAYETLAESGYTAEAFNGKRVGVFIAIAQEDYKNDAIAHLFSDQKSPATTLANNLRSLAAGRIADSLNLKGPTFAIDSACSSALIAMHYARLSLQNGDCDFALVGGVNLNIGPTSFLAFSNAGALSPSAKSYLFDERNHGILLGEGAGMLLLTPAHAADRPILAILKGSAVNNDGQSHGPMTPNTAGQQQVMQAAYETSGINPADLGYIEAHGTGTPIGDVVEARTLNRFFGRLKEIDPPTRYVGSMKPNVGHLLSAAGIASLIKVVLALHHKQIPPSLNCQQPRKKLRLGQVGLIINDQPILWETGKGKARLAGINAFAFGGTNAHVILQEATDQPERQPLPPPVFTRQHLRISPQAPPGYAKLTRPSKELSSWLHRVVWQPTPLPAIDSTILDTPLPTVITAADGEAGFRLANLLKNQGLDCEFCQPHQLTQQQNSFRLLLVAADYEFVRSTAKVLTQLSQGSVDSISIISHQDPLEPDAALIAGFSHALNDELHIPVQFIGFGGELSNAPLLAELIRPTATSTVWWHKDARFVRKVVPLPADQAASTTPISKDGVYLITGGGSGVGAAIAKGLALDVAPTLILVGRKSLSDALERADFLGKLRWAGATADYIAADVSDAAQVDQLISQILEKYGRLDGVIHAA
ncbi:MAG: SDR family NAD(P)-dependent oxidoreductase, partial [Anaerolineae bacterium]